MDSEGHEKISHLNITEESFYSKANSILYSAYMKLQDEVESYDIITIVNKLKEMGKLNEVGGTPYLVDVIGVLTTSANIVYFAESIEDMAMKRGIISNATLAIEDSYNETESGLETLDKLSSNLFSLSEKKINKHPVEIGRLLMDTYTEIEELSKSDTIVSGISTGYESIDLMMNGWQKDTLSIIAARPSMGKSLLMSNMAINSAKKGNTTAIFSLEMGKSELTKRMLSSEGDISLSRIKTGKIQDSVFNGWERLANAMHKLNSIPLYVDDSESATLLDIRTKCRRLKKDKDLKLVFIDYLGLMDFDKGVERHEGIGRISRGLKKLSKELGIPIVLLSQLNREVDKRPDKRPVLSDLRDSGCLTRDSIITNSTTGERFTIGDVSDENMRFKTLSLNTDTNKVEEDNIINAFSSGIKDVYAIKTRRGRVIKTSDNHPFLKYEGWTEQKHLKVGDKIGVIADSDFKLKENPMNDNELILVGHLLGDGSILEGQPYRYASGDIRNIDIVNKSAFELFGIKARVRDEGGCFQTYLTSPHHLTHGKHHPITTWFKELNIKRARSYNKAVPEKVFQCSNEGIILFLKHLWATDGGLSISKGNVICNYGSNSRVLAEQVQDLLLRIGIVSSIYTSKQEKNGKIYKDMYNVTLNSAVEKLKFLKIVGCYGKRGDKREECISILEKKKVNPNVNTYHKDVWVLIEQEIRRKGFSLKGFAREMGVQYSSTWKKNGVSHDRLRRFAKVLGSEKLYLLANSDVSWDEIVSIEHLGKEETFDITTEKNHNFISGGYFILHNSVEQDADNVLFVLRPEVYEKTPENDGKVIILISKQRSGPIGDVILRFNKESVKFEEVDRYV